jgi:hypothetical protein
MVADPRIHPGWIAYTSSATGDEERLRAWREAHRDFSPWTSDWFAVECAADLAADDFDAARGTGSALLFRTLRCAEKFGSREPVVASGVRPLQAVWYADVSRRYVPDVIRQEYAARLRGIGASLVAGAPGAGPLGDSGVLVAPATDAGATALGAALDAVDALQAWVRQQEFRLVEEAEGARG